MNKYKPKQGIDWEDELPHQGAALSEPWARKTSQTMSRT
jgi:hypothetical protein